MVEQAAVRFFHVWDTYARVVAENYMYHRELGAAVRGVLEKRFASRPFTILDLGCGDAATFAPLLDGLPVASYRGADLSAAALAIAGENLSNLGCLVDLRHADMMDELINAPAQDLIYASFALHHFETAAKEKFFRHVAERLTPDGVFVLVDVVREEGESLPDYLESYTGWIRNGRTSLTGAEHDAICDHIRNNDLPEAVSTLDGFATSAGMKRIGIAEPHKWHRMLVFERRHAG